MEIIWGGLRRITTADDTQFGTRDGSQLLLLRPSVNMCTARSHLSLSLVHLTVMVEQNAINFSTAYCKCISAMMLNDDKLSQNDDTVLSIVVAVRHDAWLLLHTHT